MKGTKLVILSSLLLTATSLGAKPLTDRLDEPETLHVAAHTGLSYVLTHSTQAVCTSAAGSDHKLACTILGVATAASAGAVKEVVIDKGESNKRHALGYVEDGLGIGAAVTFISINW